VSKQANPTLIGGFVLGGAALLIAFVLVIAGDKLFRDEEKFLVFFEGSVYGLNIGSRVMFRGVPIGYVSGIEALADFETMEFAVPVYINIIRDSIAVKNASRGFGGKIGEGDLDTLIDMGLRASLGSESMITGQLFVELDFHPDSPEIYRGKDFNTKEIPTIPSGIQEVIRNAQTFVADIQKNLDIPKVTEDFTKVVAGIEALVNSEDTQQLSADMRITLEKARTTLDQAATVFAEAGDDFDPALIAFTEVLEQTQDLLETADRTLQNDADIAYRLGKTLQELETAARSVRALADQLQDQPDSLIRGKR